MSEGKRPGDGQGIGIGTWLGGLALGAIVAALLLAVYNIGKSEGEEQAAGGGGAAAKAEPGGRGAAGPGELLFSSHCGSCHTLEVAATSGTAGPVLDDLRPSRRQVLAAIENGGASGAMPSGLLSGEDAELVAAFVAEGAGR